VRYRAAQRLGLIVPGPPAGRDEAATKPA